MIFQAKAAAAQPLQHHLNWPRDLLGARNQSPKLRRWTTETGLFTFFNAGCPPPTSCFKPKLPPRSRSIARSGQGCIPKARTDDKFSYSFTLLSTFFFFLEHANQEPVFFSCRMPTPNVIFQAQAAAAQPLRHQVWTGHGDGPRLEPAPPPAPLPPAPRQQIVWRDEIEVDDNQEEENDSGGC
jgi:hypothetical protein